MVFISISFLLQKRPASHPPIDAASGLDGNVVIVDNSAGVLLPSTGGGGTMGYYLSGGALVCIALGAFGWKRQRLIAPA